MGLLSVLGLKPSSPQGATPADPGVENDTVDAGGGAAPADKNQAAFTAARDAMVKLLDALNAHAQQSRITAEIGQVQAKLAEADDHAAKKEWKKATAALGEMKKLADAAKKLAADWADYAKRRASTMAAILAFKTDEHSVDGPIGIVTANADGAANQTPPDFKTAIKFLKALDAKRKPQVVNQVKDVKTRLAALEKANTKVKGYLEPALAAARPLVAAAEQAMTDDDPALARQSAIAALRLIGPAERRTGRRAAFDTQRAATIKSVEAVRAATAVSAHGADLDKSVTDADALADVGTLKIEEGVQLLVQTKKRADVWVGLAKTVAATQAGQKSAEADLALLDTHVAAARITAERDAIRTLLVDSKSTQTSADSAPDPAPGWAAAHTAVIRAQADLVTAKKLADGFGPAAAAEAAAGKPDDVAGLKDALKKLRADGQAAHKAAYAAAAKAEFQLFDDRVLVTDKALTANDGATAAPALAEAAKALVAAKTRQAEHGQYQALLTSVEAQVKKLHASPRAAKIKVRIDPIDAGIVTAEADDQAGKGPEALVAIRAANDLVAVATHADEQRKAFDTRADAAAKRVAAVKDNATKTALQKDIDDAKLQADALDFDAASKAVQQVEVKLDKVKLEGLMAAAKPNQGDIAALAKAMTKNGGAQTIDDMIQAVPDGGNADLISAMATGRYGVKFTAGKALDANGDIAKAMKLSCKMFATIPQDIVGNKSITSVAFEDLDPGISAGHNYGTAAITMKGRAGAVNQDFGANLKEEDPKNPGTLVDQLPAVEDKCKPADDTSVDFLSFAAAHEVGHGVDEERGFMRKNGAGAEYGGWVTFGSNLQPLADAIGASAKFAAFYKTPEQKKYILDKLQSRDAQAPAVALGTPEANAKRDFDNWHAMATSKEVCRRQSDSESLKLDDGKIYHEAYARVWVGYDADARKRGLTGYQFRAPGEWFAELYAGYRSQKLKPDHPAMAWLTKL